jgi:hypothetical protein
MRVFFMSEEDLKLIISKYQQKVFELFNQNIVLETQVDKLSAAVSSLSDELEKLKKPKRGTKVEGDFE